MAEQKQHPSLLGQLISSVTGGSPAKSVSEMDLEEFRQTMEQIAREDADKMAIIRDSLGITQSLQTPEQVQQSIQSAKGGPDTTTMVDVTDTDQGQLSSPEPLVEMARQVREEDIQVKALEPLYEKAATDDDMGLPSSPSQVEELKGLYAKKGKEYRKDQIVDWSYINDPLVDGGVRGNSRVWGDASIETQNTVIDRIVSKGREEGLDDRKIALVLAIAKVESGFNPDAAAGTTSARGLGQFINRTGNTYGITEENQWDLDTQINALIAHTKDNMKLAEGRGEEYIYAFHHDGPSLAYGGLDISKNKVMPLVNQFETFLQGKGTLQEPDYPDQTRGTSPRPVLREGSDRSTSPRPQLRPEE